MASLRKKQDEKNLKLLRDLASLQHNKYCFDCNQRGPTYVNVTIGSFVCTKCSGILRGLTPPHRVKSISMATFSPEEVEILRNKGNNYCRRTWLGLYEGNLLSDSRDEQIVRDFMIDKYERKRYYLEPTPVTMNGIDSQNTVQPTNKNSQEKLTNNLTILQKPQINGIITEKNNKNSNGKISDFVADFGSADIYNAVNANKNSIINKNINNNNNNNAVQVPFANFDNNSIFTSNDVPTFNTTNGINGQQPNSTVPPAPSEDRYAALKDLDNALKEKPQIDWNSGFNGSSYSSATPTSSSYSSPSPHGSVYGSPSPDQFLNLFPQQDAPKVSNPFNTGISWGENVNHQTANPFRPSNNKVNGISTSFYTTPSFSNTNSNPWIPNPFMTGSSTSNGNSSNPFL